MTHVVRLSRPLAITGASAISAHGHAWRGLGQALADERISPAATNSLTPSHGPVPGSEVRNIPRPESPAERNARKLMSRGALLASLAVRALVRDQEGWSPPFHDLGYYLGVGASGGAMSQLRSMLHASLVPAESDNGLMLSMAQFGEAGLKRCNPLFAFQLMNNFTLCHGAILADIRGPNAAFFSRGSGTLSALAEAAHAVATGVCPRALAGGADSALHPVTYAELLRDGFTGVAPGEGAALLALQADPSGALAFLEAHAVWPATAHQPGTWPDADDVRWTELERFVARPTGEPIELVLLAPWGGGARKALRSWTDEHLPGARKIDVGQQLGESLAATPALAWTAALDLLCAGDGTRALVVSAGVDGDLCAVLLRAPTATVAPSGESERPARSQAAAVDPARTPVITGVGAVSAFGLGVERLWDGLAADASAVVPITCFDASTFPARVAAQIPPATMAAVRDRLGAHIADEEWRDRKLPFGLAAALEAWAQAGCGPSERDAWLRLALGLEHALLGDFAAIFDLGEHPRGRDATIDWRREPELSGPRIRFRTPVDLCARAVRRELGLVGSSATHVSACAAGALSVANAASLIARGAASMVVCGGADSMINPLGLGGMSRLGAPSPRNDVDACRPFDRRRDGLVMGEGGAVLVVESLARAEARGIRPLARILGWGSTQDAYKATAPRPDASAAARAMSTALARAGCGPTDIGYINAHGTGTPLNDPTEIAAIQSALGSAAAEIPISSIKGALGHLMAASGAIELAACLMAFTRDILPGTAHLQEPDPECLPASAGLSLLTAARPAHVDVVMSNSFGFGGQNATVILGRYS